MIGYSNLDAAHPPQQEALLEAGPCFSIDGEDINPVQQGYTVVHNYAHYFWRPYLGHNAFALWELLLSFCYGDSDTAYPSISRLARMLTNRDHSRTLVIGRNKTKTSEVCETSEVSRRDVALDILVRERLVQVIRRGRCSSHTFRICKVLPLLRPEQVACLSPALQEDHALWLARYGIDRQAYQQAFDASASQSAVGTLPLAVASSHLGQHAPTGAALQPVAPDNRPVAPATNGVAPGTTPVAPGTTNNPHQETSPKQWWQEALSELRLQLPRNTFELCLQRTRVHSFENGLLTLQAPSPVVQDVLQHRLARLIHRELAAASEGRVQRVSFG